MLRGSCPGPSRGERASRARPARPQGAQLASRVWEGRGGRPGKQCDSGHAGWMGPARSHVEMCPGRRAVLGPESTARVVYGNQCPEVKCDLPAPPGLQGGAPDLQLPLNNAVSSVVPSDLMYRVLGTLTVPPRPTVTAFPHPRELAALGLPQFPSTFGGSKEPPGGKGTSTVTSQPRKLQSPRVGPCIHSGRL